MKLETMNAVCPKCHNGNYMRYMIHDDGFTHFPYEVKCINCNSYFTKKQVFGYDDAGAIDKPHTRAERIRGMTDKEMVEILKKYLGCNWCPGFYVNCKCKCDEYWLDWLQEDAEI